MTQSAVEEPAALAAFAGRDVLRRETHTSWVFLVGDRAYKVKKPVAYPFLDQSTRELRAAACRTEVELNRPLAPGIYLAVRAIVPDGAGGFTLATDGDAAAVEHAVEMERFPDDATLAARARARRLRPVDVEAVASRLAAFHRDARTVAAPTEPAAAAAAALALLHRNVEELMGLLADGAARRAVAAQARCADAFVASRAETFAARASAGRVRDLHGDLRAEHVLLGSGGAPPRFVDRLEFSRALREVDVADEVAFLAMDLTALGAVAAARRLVAAYCAAGGDIGDEAQLAYHAVYRAHVRAKVALLRGAQEEAGRLLGVAERFAWRIRLPPVLVVCGPAASGKSTLAHELAARTRRPVLSSDRVRKRLAGIAATARAGRATYAPAMSRRVYGALGREAGAAATAGEGAIVDATFRDRGDRAAFAAALAGVVGDRALVAGAPVFAECVAPAAVLGARAQGRLADPARISDATPAHALAQRAAFAPLDEVPADRHHALRTDRPAAATAEALAAARDEVLRRTPAP